MYAKEGITSATYCNALTLQVSLSLHENNILLTLQVYFARSIGQ